MSKTRTSKIISIVIIVLILLIIAAFAASWGFYRYVRNNPEEVAQRIVKQIKKRSPEAEIRLGSIEVAPINLYPRAAIYVKDFESISQLADNKIKRTISFDEADVHFSIRELIFDRLKINKIHLRGGRLDQTVDTILTKTPKSLPAKPIENKTFADEVQLIIEDFTFHSRDLAKNKEYNITGNRLAGTIWIQDQVIGSLGLDLDADVGQLGFNLDNGPFLKDTHCEGKIKFQYDVLKDTINIPFIPLKVNGEVFNVHTIICPIQNKYHFDIKNPKTNFEKTLKILPDNIVKTIGQLDFEKPLDIRCVLNGSFVYKTIPLVQVYFETENNQLTPPGQNLVMRQMNIKGEFVNRWTEESVESIESKQNFRVKIEDLGGNLNGQKIHIYDTYYGQTDTNPGLMKLHIDANGQPGFFNEVLNNPTFQFQNKGNYTLNGSFEGDFKNIPALFRDMKASFKLNNSELLYTPLDLIVPVKKIDLNKSKDDAYLNDLAIGLTKANGTLHLKGDVINLTSLLFDLDQQVSTDLSVTADVINVNYLIEQFTPKQNTTDVNRTVNSTVSEEPSAPPRSLQIILQDLYRDFNPHLSIDLDKVIYHNLTVKDLTADFGFEGDRIFAFQNMGFGYEDGSFLTTVGFDVRDVENQQFDLDVKTNNLDIWQLLNDLSLNEVSSTRQRDRINGNVDLDAQFKGRYRESSGIDMQLLDSKIDFAVRNLKFIGLNPIYALQNIEKLDTVNFDDIRNVITFDNQVITIPPMEIHGTGIDLDIGGTADYKIQNIALSESQKKYQEKADAYAKMNVKIYGEAQRLNQLFNNKNFLFLNYGTFNLDTKIDGPISMSEQLLNKTITELQIDSAHLLYKPQNLEFIVPRMDLTLQDYDAKLHDFIINLKGTEHYINLTGDVENAYTFFFGGDRKVSTNLSLEADYFNWFEFADLLGLNRDDSDPDKPEMAATSQDSTESKNNKDITLILDMIYNTFNPNVSVNIDQYTYNQYTLDSVRTNVGFSGQRNVILQNTGFQYGDGSVNVDLSVNLEDSIIADIGITTNLQDINFKRLLNDFEFFGMESFENAEELDGNISLLGTFEGKLNRYEGIYPESIKGNIEFKLDSLRLFRFEPVQKMGNIVFRKKRVEDVRFAPITNTLEIKNKQIIIPRMEISSTAFDLFVEGVIGYENDTNIWVAIPLSNFRTRHYGDVPEKNDLNYTQNKIFLNIHDKNGETEYHLHGNNKDQFIQNGKTIESYEQSKKDRKEARRQYKKLQRQQKKNQ